MTWPELRIYLPLPPSANELWTVAKGRIISSKKLREFTKDAHRRLQCLAEQHALQPMTGPVRISGTYYLPTLASDGPNRDKALFDALQGYVYENDRQIGEWRMAKTFPVPGEPPIGGVQFTASCLAHPELAARLDEARARPKKQRITHSTTWPAAKPSVYRGGA